LAPLSWIDYETAGRREGRHFLAGIAVAFFDLVEGAGRFLGEEVGEVDALEEIGPNVTDMDCREK